MLVADVYAERLLRLARGKAVRKTLDYTDEGFAFALDFGADWEGTLRGFLESEGLSLGEAYFMGRANPKGPFAVVAEVVVPPKRGGEEGGPDAGSTPDAVPGGGGA